MDGNLEKECSALGGLFQTIVNDIKGAYPAWEDCGAKAQKLSGQIKATISAINLFLDALQRVADVATNAKGATRDIGTALTRICMRHRSIENRLKSLSSALVDHLVAPLQEKADDWRTKALVLDKEHAKEYKKTRMDIRKRSEDTMKLQKKVRKGDSRMQPMLDSAVHEVNDRYIVLLQSERKMVKKALIEQRAQFCLFVSWLKPVLDFELGLMEEVSHLQDVTDLLCRHSADPFVLPQASEYVIYDVKGLEHTLGVSHHFQTPPSSPSSTMGSRKSSFCSLSSAESGGQQQMLALTHGTPGGHAQQGGGQRGRTQNARGQLATEAFFRQTGHRQAPPSPRFSSMSSQDSGIAASHDVIYAPPTQKQIPMSDEDSPQGSLEEADTTEESPGSQQSTPSPSPSAVTWPSGPPSAHMAALLASGAGSGHYRVPAKLNSTGGGGGGNHEMPAALPQQPRPHTISAAFEARGLKQRASLASAGLGAKAQAATLDRPVSLGLGRKLMGGGGAAEKPPPPPGKRSAAATPLQTPTPTMTNHPRTIPQIPDFNAAQPDQIVIQPIYANVNDLNCQAVYSQHQEISPRHQRGLTPTGQGPGRPVGEEGWGGYRRNGVGANGKPRRPSSFAGDDEDITRLLEAAGMYCTDRGATRNLDGGGSPRHSSGTMVAEEDEKTLVEDCVDETESLSSKLEEYCDPTSRESCSVTTIGDSCDDQTLSESKNAEIVASPYCTMPRSGNYVKNVANYWNGVKFRDGKGPVARSCNLPVLSERSVLSTGATGEALYAVCSTATINSTGTLTRRHSTVGGGKPPPPPPARRTSTITAATPTAPAVDFVRSSSRCTTPVEENYAITQQCLNLRMSYNQYLDVNAPNHAQYPPAVVAQSVSGGVSPYHHRYPEPPVVEGQCTTATVFTHRHYQQQQQQQSQMNQILNHDHQMQHGNSQQQMQFTHSGAAANGRMSEDFPPPPPPMNTVHETMLMQIRNGVKLRKGSRGEEQRSEPTL